MLWLDRFDLSVTDVCSPLKIEAEMARVSSTAASKTFTGHRRDLHQLTRYAFYACRVSEAKGQALTADLEQLEG